MNVRRTVAALTSAAALSVTGVAMATPASAAGPVVTGGLINITITDISLTDTVDVVALNDSINNNNVEILNDVDVKIGVAAQVIAQVCDTNVGVLAVVLDGGTATCNVDGGTLTFSQA